MHDKSANTLDNKILDNKITTLRMQNVKHDELAQLLLFRAKNNENHSTALSDIAEVFEITSTEKLLADAYLLRSQINIKENKKTEAIDSFDMFAKTYDKLINEHNNLAKKNLANSEYTAAIDDFTSIIELYNYLQLGGINKDIDKDIACTYFNRAFVISEHLKKNPELEKEKYTTYDKKYKDDLLKATKLGCSIEDTELLGILEKYIEERHKVTVTKRKQYANSNNIRKNIKYPEKNDTKDTPVKQDIKKDIPETKSVNFSTDHTTINTINTNTNKTIPSTKKPLPKTPLPKTPVNNNQTATKSQNATPVETNNSQTKPDHQRRDNANLLAPQTDGQYLKEHQESLNKSHSLNDIIKKQRTLAKQYNETFDVVAFTEYLNKKDSNVTLELVKKIITQQEQQEQKLYSYIQGFLTEAEENNKHLNPQAIANYYSKKFEDASITKEVIQQIITQITQEKLHSAIWKLFNDSKQKSQRLNTKVIAEHFSKKFGDESITKEVVDEIIKEIDPGYSAIKNQTTSNQANQGKVYTEAEHDFYKGLYMTCVNAVTSGKKRETIHLTDLQKEEQNAKNTLEEIEQALKQQKNAIKYSNGASKPNEEKIYKRRTATPSMLITRELLADLENKDPYKNLHTNRVNNQNNSNVLTPSRY